MSPLISNGIENSDSVSHVLRYGSRRERNKFIVEAFNDYFGEETKLQNWQKLCTHLGIQGPPTSIRQCRKELRKTRVNVWDLVESVKNGTEVKIWPSKWELIEYTQRERRTFPLAKAKNVGPVKELLRQMY